MKSWLHPPCTVSVPNLHLSLCTWKPQRSLATCFNLFNGSFQNKQVLKTLQSKTVKPLSQLCAQLSWLWQHYWKKYVIHWRTLSICSSALHGMPIHTEHSFASNATCHHAERISCKVTETGKLQSVVSPTLENVATPSYHKLYVKLNVLLTPLSHALNQHSVTRTKNFFSYPAPAPHSLLYRFPHQPDKNMG